MRVQVGARMFGSVSLLELHDEWRDNALAGFEQGSFVRYSSSQSMGSTVASPHCQHGCKPDTSECIQSIVCANGLKQKRNISQILLPCGKTLEYLP